MPLPLALVPSIVAWGTRSAAVYGLARLLSDEPIQDLENMLKAWVVEQAAYYAGIELDPETPWSDASLAGGVGQKIGIPLRSLRDRQMITEDLDAYLVAMIEQKSGYRITTVLDRDLLRKDIERIALAVMSEKLGLPVGLVGEEIDPEAIKANLLAWAKAELLANMGEEIGMAVAEIVEAGALDAVASDMNSKLKNIGAVDMVSAQRLAVLVANKLAAGAVADYGKTAAGMNKKNRRREQNRQAQAKFRRLHGNRQKYVPLNMSAQIG